MSRSATPRPAHPAAQRPRVRGLHRPEAAVAAAVVGGADRAAAGVRDRARGRACRARPSRTRCRAACTRCTRCGRGPAGARRAGGAPITSSSWGLLIGQPRSSKSTCTCAPIGVEVASVEMYSGARRRSTRTRPRRRSCAAPGCRPRSRRRRSSRAVAMRRTSWMRSASSAVVIEPSTRDRSYGPSTVARAPRGSTRPRSRRPARAARPRSRAGSAGSRRTRRTSTPPAWASRHSSRIASQARTSSQLKTGPSRQTSVGPELAVPAVADGALHVALHRHVGAVGADAAARAAPRPRSASSPRARRSMPTALPGRTRRASISFGTTPTLPRHSRRRRRR